MQKQNNQSDDSKNKIKVSARRLAEMIHRSGGLAMPAYGGIDALDGIKLHKKFSKYLSKGNLGSFSSNAGNVDIGKFPGDDSLDNSDFNNIGIDSVANYAVKNEGQDEDFIKYDHVFSELSLKGIYQQSEFDLVINGRLDNLTIKDNKLTLYEVKSFRGNSAFLPEHGEPVHWAQLKIYAYLIKHIQLDDYAETTKQKTPELIESIEQAIQSENVRLSLVYISVDNNEIVEKSKNFVWAELSEFMETTCKEYIFRMQNIFLWQDLRDKSIKEAGFPFVSLRDGQTEMMRQTLATIRDNTSILIQAPTGIGKTIATLYPALKALSAKYVSRVFYATAMISTRKVALDSLQILRNCGFMIRSILLQAKEKICTQPDLFCEQTICPFAVDYYQRLPDAINELLPLQDITPKKITEIALKHQVCPHELSLDFSDYCDVIVGDYNHVFDPQAKIQRFFDVQDDDNKTAILIDEAHNLPARARTMYSAGINGEDFLKVRNILKQPNLGFSNQYSSLLNTLEIISYELINFSKVFKTCKKPNKNSFFSEKIGSQWLIDQDFIGVRQLPDMLISQIGRLIYLLRDFLDQQRMFEGRQEILNFWFDLLYFVKVSEFYFDDAYITAFRPVEVKLNSNTIKSLSGENITHSKNNQLDPDKQETPQITQINSDKQEQPDAKSTILADCYLLALDTAKHLTKCYLNKQPTIFFSATLSPINYYHSLLNSEIREKPAETLMLPSPFPHDNRLIGALTEFSVKFKDREQTMPSIAKFILEACQLRTGNYLIFVPSYQYLFQIKNVIEKLKHEYHKKKLDPSNLHPSIESLDFNNLKNQRNNLKTNSHYFHNIEFMFQDRKMTELQKRAFLKKFEQFGEKTMLAFAVLGSHFNEGIDLQGEKLSGVFVIGTGIPQISPEREIMTQYYAEKYEGGRAYGYQYPGFNRVQQAVGRLIRSENDIGFSVLIDDRYASHEWHTIFPDDWHVKQFDQHQDLLDEIQVFWQDHGL